MRIVVDANIILAAIMGSGATIAIIRSQNHELYAPRKIVEGIYNHKKEICDYCSYTSKNLA